MKLTFKSKLGHRVQHKVVQLKRNLYETTTPSRLVLKLNGSGVYLTAGHDNYNLRSLSWTPNQNAHHYHEPILLGYGGEVQ